MNKTMHENNGHGSIYMTIGTVFIYLLSVFTVQQWAAVATIFAGVATGGFTLYKWWRLYKNKSKPEE